MRILPWWAAKICVPWLWPSSLASAAAARRRPVRSALVPFRPRESPWWRKTLSSSQHLSWKPNKPANLLWRPCLNERHEYYDAGGVQCQRYILQRRRRFHYQISTQIFLLWNSIITRRQPRCCRIEKYEIDSFPNLFINHLDCFCFSFFLSQSSSDLLGDHWSYRYRNKQPPLLLASQSIYISRGMDASFFFQLML